MRAGLKPSIHGAVGVRLQRVPEARAASARRLIASQTVGLLAFQGRQRGIVGVLRQTLEHGEALPVPLRHPTRRAVYQQRLRTCAAALGGLPRGDRRVSRRVGAPRFMRSSQPHRHRTTAWANRIRSAMGRSGRRGCYANRYLRRSSSDARLGCVEN